MARWLLLLALLQCGRTAAAAPAAEPAHPASGAGTGGDWDGLFTIPPNLTLPSHALLTGGTALAVSSRSTHCGFNSNLEQIRVAAHDRFSRCECAIVTAALFPPGTASFHGEVGAGGVSLGSIRPSGWAARCCPIAFVSEGQAVDANASMGWDLLRLATLPHLGDQAKSASSLKITLPILLPNVKWSVWVDAKLRTLDNAVPLTALGLGFGHGAPHGLDDGALLVADRTFFDKGRSVRSTKYGRFTLEREFLGSFVHMRCRDPPLSTDTSSGFFSQLLRSRERYLAAGYNFSATRLRMPNTWLLRWRAGESRCGGLSAASGACAWHREHAAGTAREQTSFNYALDSLPLADSEAPSRSFGLRCVGLFDGRLPKPAGKFKAPTLEDRCVSRFTEQYRERTGQARMRSRGPGAEFNS